MDNATSLLDLLELESDPAFHDLVCPTTGVIAWPSIRNDVLRLLLSDLVYPTAPILDLEGRSALRRVVSGAARAVAHDRSHPTRRSDVLIIATGAGLLPREDRTYNRYIDGFADALGERAWTMEGLFQDAWPDAPRSNPRLGFLAADRFRVAVSMRISPRAVHRALASDLVDLVARAGRDKLGWELDVRRRAALQLAAARRLAAYPTRARNAHRLLDQTQAHVALVEEGCYGHFAVFNAVARDRGVHVAEFQHGMITPGHDAYNVHPQLGAHRNYRRTQPSSLLTYGDWWNAAYNAPVPGVSVGNPHREDALASWRPAAVRNRVLVIGDGVETQLYLDLCRELAGIVPAPLQVTFRPHPLERERTGGVRNTRFDLDLERDLYRSLANADVVVGESSTAIFESVGLVRRIFVWDTPKSRMYLGDHPFDRFGTAQHLAEQIRTAGDGIAAEIADEIWASDWRGRFQGYLDRLMPSRP